MATQLTAASNKTTMRTILLGMAGASVLAAIVAWPFLAGPYMTLLLAQAFVFAVAAVSLDLVWGYAGIPELGHSLWFGIGALTMGVMTTEVSPTGMVLSGGGSLATYLLATALGVVLAMVLAAIVAWYSFSRRSSHFYIAVVGLALAAAAQPAYSQFPQLTGGEAGLFGFGFMRTARVEWYYFTLLVLIAAVAASVILVRSDFGLLIRAIRDNENRVRYLGFNVERVKIAIYALGAGIAALAGAIFAAMTGAVSAPLFGFLFATEMMVWVAVGGRATIIGPAIGTIVLSLAASKLSASFPVGWSLFLGLAFVAVVVFLPDGVLPPVLRPFMNQVRSVFGRVGGRQLVSAASGQQSGQVQQGEAVRLSGLEFGYGRLQVLRGVDLDIKCGELLCIVGPNGAGKSTLIEVVTDGERTFGGGVAYFQESWSHKGLSPDKIVRRGIVRKFQIPSLFASLTISEHVLLASAKGRWPSPFRRTDRVEAPAEVLAVCEAAGLTGRLNETGATLSHGLAQGLEMAVAVATSPRIIFMDEPTAGLSANEREQVGNILKSLTAAGLTVVLIEHDLEFVEAFADRIAVLHDGRVLESGTPAEISRSAIVRDAYLGAFDLEQKDA